MDKKQEKLIDVPREPDILDEMQHDDESVSEYLERRGWIPDGEGYVRESLEHLSMPDYRAIQIQAERDQPKLIANLVSARKEKWILLSDKSPHHGGMFDVAMNYTMFGQDAYIVGIMEFRLGFGWDFKDDSTIRIIAWRERPEFPKGFLPAPPL